MMNLIRFSERMGLTLQIYVFFSCFMCLMTDFTLVLYRIDCPTQWPNGCSVYCTSWLAPTYFPRLAMPQTELYFHSYDLRAWVEVALSGNAWIVIPCYHMFGDTPKLKIWAESHLRRTGYCEKIPGLAPILFINICEDMLAMKAAVVATLRWIRMTGGDLQFWEACH